MDPSGFLLRSDTLRGLLTAIATYRKNNGFNPGNPAHEVETVYRKDYPWLVSNVGVIETKGVDPVARWLERAWRTPQPKFVESEMQEPRCVTCLTCEHYRPDHKYDTDALRRITILGRGKYKLPGACTAHHWPVGLAVWMEAPDTPATVPGCWWPT